MVLIQVAALCLLLVPACGYRLGGHSCESSAGARNVAVPLFQNRSLLPRAENLFTEAFRDRIQFLPCYRLRQADSAEVLLKGTLLSLDTYQIAVDREFLILEYGMRVVLTVTLEKRTDGEVLWRAERVQDEIRFYASSDPLLNQENTREALQRLAWKMSERVLDKLALGF